MSEKVVSRHVVKVTMMEDGRWGKCWRFDPPIELPAGTCQVDVSEDGHVTVERLDGEDA